MPEITEKARRFDELRARLIVPWNRGSGNKEIAN